MNTKQNRKLRNKMSTQGTLKELPPSATVTESSCTVQYCTVLYCTVLLVLYSSELQYLLKLQYSHSTVLSYLKLPSCH